jgi:hypothetical protein
MRSSKKKQLMLLQPCSPAIGGQGVIQAQGLQGRSSTLNKRAYF